MGVQLGTRKRGPGRVALGRRPAGRRLPKNLCSALLLLGRRPAGRRLPKQLVQCNDPVRATTAKKLVQGNDPVRATTAKKRVPVTRVCSLRAFLFTASYNSARAVGS